ncbi:MAG: glycosyltransferase family 2 protein [Oscillospiraceae bacterium]|nr:glycosyltransferase family 2 protein [Oscillospiraceae bacterium]
MISVIVPVYNAESSLHRCIDSILTQTYMDFELLLVDDGSTDSSASICDQYAARDERVRVFHRENGGVSDARNCGLDNARGDYLCFVDSDDYVGQQYLNILLDMLLKNEADFSVVSMREVFSLDTVFTESEDVRTFLSSKEAFQEMLTGRKFGVSSWGKLYKKEIFDHIRFPQGVLYDDFYTLPYVVKNCRCCVYSTAIQYYYYHRQDSLTHSISIDSIRMWENGVRKLLNYTKNQYPDSIAYAEANFLINVFWIVIDRLFYSRDYSKTAHRIRNKYSGLFQKAWRLPMLTKKEIIKCTLFMFNIWLYRQVRIGYASNTDSGKRLLLKEEHIYDEKNRDNSVPDSENWQKAKPLISVIVPVYKVEPYLRQCVDSILKQTYRNIEIILVDDGSPDQCPNICDEYANRDTRVKIIHKKNGGLSDARNAGLEIAEGDYISFIDSDDWIEETMLEELLQAALKYKAEISCCSFIMHTGEKSTEEFDYGPERVILAEEAMFDTFYTNNVNVVVWNKLFIAELFKRVRFPKGEIHEDNAVFCQVTGAANRVAFIDLKGYHYRQRLDSIVNRGYSSQSRIVLWKDLKRMRIYLSKNYPDLLPSLKYYDARITRNLIRLYLQSGLPVEDVEYRILKKRFDKNLPYLLRHRKIGLKEKSGALFIWSGTYRWARKLIAMNKV